MLHLRQNLWLVLAILLVGIVTASAAVVAIFSTKLLLLILIATIGGVTLYLSGNIRLFIFYAMIFLAPLSIKKDFLYLSHMAGATSFDLHISDPFLLAMIAFQLWDRVKGKPILFRFPRPMFLWMTLMAIGLWSAAFSHMLLPPAHEVYRMTRLLLWVIVLVNEVVRRKQFLHAAYALLIAAVFQAAFAYLQILGLDFGLEHYGQLTKKGMENLGASTLSGELGVLRISGIMTHPNVLGAYLALSSGIAISLMFSTLSSFIKIIAATVSASFAIIIILTLSRASWVDFAIVVLGVTLLTNTNHYARKRYMTHRTAVFAGLIIIGIAFSGQIITRMTHSVPQGLSSRWEFVETAKKMIIEKPWFGYGLNTYTFYQPTYNKYGSINSMIKAYGTPGNWPVVHNSYLLIWVEQGTIGFIIWMWLHAAIIRVGIQNLKLRDPTLHALNVALMVGFIAIMFDGLVSFFERLHEGILVWTFAGLILALSYWRQENELNPAQSTDTQAGSLSTPLISQVDKTHRPSSSAWLPHSPLSNLKRVDESPINAKKIQQTGWIRPKGRQNHDDSPLSKDSKR